MRTLNTEEQRAKWRAAYHRTHPRKAPRTFFHEGLQRIVTHDHYATRIFWDSQMIDTLKRDFATTLNEELAGVLGVSIRTMIRKARELGLEKDRQWLRDISNARLLMATPVAIETVIKAESKKASIAAPKQSLRKEIDKE